MPKPLAPARSVDDRTPRVLFVTDYLHVPQGGGGAERNTHELCLALRATGMSVAVSCFLQVDGSLMSWASRLRRKLPPRREYSRDRGLGYDVFRGWDHSRIGEVIGRFRPDVAVVQSTHPEPLIRALATYHLPTLAYFHEVEAIDHLGFLRDVGVPVLANSAFTAGRLAEVCGLSSEVVLPLIDARQYRTAVQPGRVLFVNTIPRKGVETAFAVAECRPDIPFDFLLSWTHKAPALEMLRMRAKAAGNITLQPPTQDMRPIYGRAKLLLAPSQWEEAWGRVATEAHVNGIPVIGSDRGGLPQAIGPGGIVLPADAPAESWVAAVSSLWDDRAAYDRTASAARAYAARPEIQPETIVATLRAILGHAIRQERANSCG